MDRLHDLTKFSIADLKCQNSLPRSRNKEFLVEIFQMQIFRILKLKSLKSGSRKKNSVVLPISEFFKAGLHISAEHLCKDLWIQTANLNLTAQTARSDHTSGRKFSRRDSTSRHKNIRCPRARKHSAHRKSLRKFHRHVLCGVHSKINLISQQCLLQLFCEHTLSSKTRQRTIENLVSLCAHRNDFNFQIRKTFFQFLLYHLRLYHRQTAFSRPNTKFHTLTYPLIPVIFQADFKFTPATPNFSKSHFYL